MRANLSDEVIAGLEHRKAQYLVKDKNTIGMYVYVYASGIKAYFVHVMTMNRSLVKVKVGLLGDLSYKDAREKAIELTAKLKACKNRDEANQVAKAYRLENNLSPNESGVTKDNSSGGLLAQINNNNLPHPHIDMRIKDGGNLIFKYAWPGLNIAIDVVSLNLIDLSMVGAKKLVGKHNAATLLGWDVYLVTPAMVYNGSAIDLISRAIKSKMELSHAAQD